MTDQRMPAELAAILNRMDFRDKNGHPLINCAEFNELLGLADLDTSAEARERVIGSMKTALDHGDGVKAFERGFARVAEIIGEMSIGAGLPQVAEFEYLDPDGNVIEKRAFPGSNLKTVLSAIYTRLQQDPAYSPLVYAHERCRRLERKLNAIFEAFRDVDIVGAAVDTPEGVRYTQLSETKLNKLRAVSSVTSEVTSL